MDNNNLNNSKNDEKDLISNGPNNNDINPGSKTNEEQEVESNNISDKSKSLNKSLISSNTCPITPPHKSEFFYKSFKNSKKSIEKIKSNPILIKNLNECIENLKIMLSIKKSSQNVSKDINKNFRLYDDDKDYDISDVSSLDLNEEN